MKGRLLTIEEIERIEEGTVYVESTNSSVPNGVYKYKENNYFDNGKGNSFFNKCVAIQHNTIKVYEHIEETKTYKTSEMIAMLEENPKLKFKYDTGYEKGMVSVFDGDIKVYAENDCVNKNTRNLSLHGGFLRLTWTLIEEPKEVTFLEAVKLYKKGKKIFCKLDGVLTLTPNQKHYLFDKRAISVDEILKGKWYVED